MTVTIGEIAAKAGVSAAAVSKALNGKRDISAATRERVRRIAERMGYAANPAARALVSGRTMTVGLVIPFPELAAGMERVQGVQERCDQDGYLATCAFHGGAPDEQARRLSYLKGRVDGVIVTPVGNGDGFRDAAKELSVPVVFMSETLPGVEMDFVADDDEEGGCLAAAHLIDGGHRHFAYFGNAAAIHSDQRILRGARRACEERGIDFEAVPRIWGNSSRERTAANWGRIAAKRPDVSAVFCFSDMAALWVMEAALNQGRKVPDDLAVVGYDDIQFAAMAKIPLTSVAQPNAEIGRQAVSLLLERIAAGSGSTAPRKIVFSPKLVIRQSSVL